MNYIVHGRLIKINVAYNMDCMEAMKQFPDKYFDLAVVDPPYGDGCSQSVNVERETNTERGQGSVEDLTGTNTRLAKVNRGGVAREEQIPPRYTINGRTADSRTERGVMRTGGGWSKKYDPTKKSLRGMSRRGRSILRNCSASHETR